MYASKTPTKPYMLIVNLSRHRILRYVYVWKKLVLLQEPPQGWPSASAPVWVDDMSDTIPYT
jgi:hypothetical protein